jgi:hypothetical protein
MKPNPRSLTSRLIFPVAIERYLSYRLLIDPKVRFSRSGSGRRLAGAETRYKTWECLLLEAGRPKVWWEE